MFYPLPKKIQLQSSQAKWPVQSNQSVLLVVGLHELRLDPQAEQSVLLKNLKELMKKAQALQIPIVEIYGDDATQGMQRLGELLFKYPQLMITGKMTVLLKQMLPHIKSVTEQICLVDDAILLSNQEQHIHWVDSMTSQNIHHMNSYSLKRLWSLTAPSDLILSSNGVLLAIAEQLDILASEIDPHASLLDYGLDSIAMISLIGLWRANGANITFEDFTEQTSLATLMKRLNVN